VSAAGCTPVADESTDGNSTGNWDPEPVEEGFEASAVEPMITSDQMRKKLGANSQAKFERNGRAFISAMLANSGANSLKPLAGQPLKMIDLSNTEISNLEPLNGMPLEQIGMLSTSVKDLSPLKGAPLKLLDASRTPIADLAPIAGMTTLTHVYLEKSQVEDVSPLQGLELQALYLNDCPVSKLFALRGKTFQELNLSGTKITSLDDVATMNVTGILWFRDTEISDLSPIANNSYVSLDLQGTKVTDLAPLANMRSLQRLNISETEITDLTPLKDLALMRLIFNPKKITTGLEVIREMRSIRELDTTFDGIAKPKSPAQFWEEFDASKKPTEQGTE